MPRPHQRLALYVVLLAAVIPGLASGQSAEPQVAPGTPEHLLSGIDIFGSIGPVIAKEGKPNRIQELPAPVGGPTTGFKIYVWVRQSTQLEVRTIHYIDTKTGKEVEGPTYSVDVVGRTPFEKVGVTGAGLALGDSFDKAREIYGPYFFWRNLIVIEWKNRTQLAIALDGDGRISRILLVASQV
jgi:hypothetical protein